MDSVLLLCIAAITWNKWSIVFYRLRVNDSTALWTGTHYLIYLPPPPFPRPPHTPGTLCVLHGKCLGYKNVKLV